MRRSTPQRLNLKRFRRSKRQAALTRRFQVESLEPRMLLASDVAPDHDHDHDAPHTFAKEPQALIDAGYAAEAALAGSGLPQGLAPLTDTFLLHSNPGANHTVYLDFDGHVSSGTTWNGGATINSPAYDIDGNSSSFSNTELQRIQRIWQRVAEDFAPFEINVTTEDPGEAALRRSGAGDVTWGTRVVITDDTWANCGCGGHAYIGSFNDSLDEPVFVYNTSEIGVSAAASHEVGHALYLSHDGLSSGVTYYNGHGANGTQEEWGPIMGSGYYANMTTWDNGDYYNSNNGSSSANYGRGPSDLDVMTTYNGFGYRSDDHGDSRNTATDLAILGVNAGNASWLDVDAFGIIGRPDDLDMFAFATGGGAINLSINSYVAETHVSQGGGQYTVSVEPTPINNQGSNLDVLATLYDSAGNLVASSNPSGLSASFSNLTLAAGDYYISVDGVGFGDWTASPPSGYGNYASLGQFQITGTIVAAEPNEAPIANNDNVVTDEDVAVVVAPLANDSDPDGDAINLAAFTQAGNGIVANLGGNTLSYTPDADFHGADSFTYTIADGKGGTATGTVSIVVQPINDAPDAVDDEVTTNEDSAIAVSVLANDFDVDDDPITVSGFTQAANGLVTDAGDGVLQYSPNGGFFGADSFTYTIDDGNGGVDTATVFVTVIEVNEAPTAVNDSIVTDEDNAATVAVLANDSDPDGDPLSVSDFSQAANGVVTLANGELAYAPDPNFHGSDSFTYLVSDGKGGTDLGTVSVVVNPVNDVPVAADDFVSLEQDTSALVLVLDNDSDIDGDSLAISQFAQGANGVVAAEGTGLRYTPTIGFVGSDSFTYSISDGNGGLDTATVHVTVSAVNQPPIAVDDSAATEEDVAVNIAVLTNDSDPDGGVLSVASFTQPAQGAVTTGENGVLIYTPPANFHGDVSFDYTIDDGNGGTDTATVSVTVAPVADISIAPLDADKSEGDSGVTAFTFEITLDEASSSIVSVDWAVPSGGDVTGEDFGGSLPSGTVSFSPGEVRRTISLDVSGDLNIENDETFTVRLSSPANGTVDSDAATGVIRNDDEPVVLTYVDVANSESTLDGSTSGDFTDTHTANGVFESLVESYSSGPRKASLEHAWNIDVSGGDVSVVFELVAGHDSSQETFRFEYFDGVSWQTLVTLDSNALKSYSVPLPTSLSGSVAIRVVDTFGRPNDSVDAVAVDYLAIVSQRTGGPIDEAPAVSIESPVDDTHVSGMVTVVADASDDNTVTQVEFFVGGASVGVDTDGTDGWSITWDTTLHPEDSSQVVTATATDNVGQTGSDSATVQVDNVDNAPTIAIASPNNGNTVTGAVTITATAADDREVSQVEFFVNGSSVGVDTDGSNGWSASWDTSGLADQSSHTVDAVVTDSGNNTASAEQVTVTVSQNAELLITSMSPSVVASGGSVNVSISGGGFVDGAIVSLANGSGPSPSVTNVVVVNGTTITATIAAKDGGPRRNRTWDVVVTNPDNSTATLSDGLLVSVGGNAPAEGEHGKGEPTRGGKGGRALYASSASRSASAETLTADMLDNAVQQAMEYWTEAGVSPHELESLANVRIHVEDLGGALLGWATDHAVWIDDDAAAHGWSGQPMHLATVVTHEFGHVLGFDHDHDHDHDVMAPTLLVDDPFAPLSHSSPTSLETRLHDELFDRLGQGDDERVSTLRWLGSMHKQNGSERWLDGLAPGTSRFESSREERKRKEEALEQLFSDADHDQDADV